MTWHNQIAGRDYWILRYEQAVAQSRKTQNGSLAAIYLKLAEHYRSLAVVCGGTAGRTSSSNTTLAM